MANQKMTADELSQIQTLQERSQTVIRELGEIEMIRINLDTRRESALKFLEDTRTQETELGKVLSEKYGDGTVDLGSGEFVPNEAPVEAAGE